MIIYMESTLVLIADDPNYRDEIQQGLPCIVNGIRYIKFLRNDSIREVNNQQP